MTLVTIHTFHACACLRCRRQRQATDLIVDLLQDKPKNLPTHLPPESSPKPNRKQRSLSARSAAVQRKRSDVMSTRTRTVQPRARSASPFVSLGRSSSAAHSTARSDTNRSRQAIGRRQVTTVASEPVAGTGARSRRDQVRPIRSEHSPAPPKKSLEWSDEHHVIRYEPEDEMRDSELDATFESVDAGAPATHASSNKTNAPPAKPYKPKPFTELVRLRRPEVTRKDRDRK